MTDFIKKSELENKWYHIDATNVVVGRLAAEITKILRGKNKATYTPNMDNGDFVVVTNVEKINSLEKNLQIKNITNILGGQVV